MVGDAFVDEREVREAREKREAGPRGPPLIAAVSEGEMRDVCEESVVEYGETGEDRVEGIYEEGERDVDCACARCEELDCTAHGEVAEVVVEAEVGTWLWKNAGGRDWIAVWKDTAMCIGGGRQIQRRLLIQLAPFHPNRLCDPLVARRQILKLGLPKINWTLAPGLDRRCYEITAAMTPIGLYPRAPWSSELLLQSCVW
ncbi:hypothetical protein DFH09DRAFT_1098292 [Mycena vulgaris]|nr:hypothetical protein DFH09DRAFT_1100373 [Mycena vulgaris]KAJ6520721.1 hypothetical protein DFH09DRAFT_1098292 [Mycena vulgaris]